MSEEDEYDRGYWDCFETLEPRIDQLEQQLDAIKALIRANKRVHEQTTSSQKQI